jgi:hypothetical protein
MENNCGPGPTVAIIQLKEEFPDTCEVSDSSQL